MTTAAPHDLTSDLAAVLSGDADAMRRQFELYPLLRAQTPVFELDGEIIVTRHEDVRIILGDPQTFSSARDRTQIGIGANSDLTPQQRAKLNELADFESGWMNDTDDPVHAELRGLVQFAFTPRRIAAMRELIQSFVDELLDPVDARSEMELVEALSHPLPLNVVCSLLGIDRERNADIRAWSDELAVAFDTGHSNLDAAYDAYTSFLGLVTEIISDRQTDGANDLLSTLFHGNDKHSGLSEKHLTGMLVLMLFAGHETTTNLIGNSIIALQDNPAQLELLRVQPDLAAGAVNEFLRHNGSVQSVRRVATRDCEIGGVAVTEGQAVRMLLASANHDEEIFTDPDTLDIRRPNAAQHVGLGYGIHRCLGAWLARLETEIAVTTLITRYPAMRISEPVEWRPMYTMHGPKKLRLRLR